jgi:ubiquinone/menaquinone biosynthesis C-methylase UbiE
MASIRTRDDTIRTERRAAPRMEGALARWYARNRGTAPQLAQYREQADTLIADLPEGGDVLEVAFGPGYLAIDMARSGRVHVTGLDLSHSFVAIASTNAHRAGVHVHFRHGDAADLPFQDCSFDLVVCQAAFKNFPRPVTTLDQMRRVLRPGGIAVIDDMNGEATRQDICDEVDRMGLSPSDAAFTRLALSWLRRRAASPAQFRQLAAASTFGDCTITTEGIGLRVVLRRSPAIGEIPFGQP